MFKKVKKCKAFTLNYMLDTSREPHCIHKSYLSHFQSDLLPIHVPWLWGWLHVESWAGVWSCCEGHCPGMLSLFVPGYRLSLLATGAGSARIECCTAVQQRISQVPLPHRAAWALLEQQDCLLAGAMGRGSGCRTGNLLNTLGSIATKGTVVPGETGTNATLHSSEFTGNVLHSSWGQRWAEDKSCGAKFSSPAPFACCICSFDWLYWNQISFDAI